jgi:hypothetical protein
LIQAFLAQEGAFIMAQQLFSVFSAGAIALAASLPAIAAPPIKPAAEDPLQMVMVDQAQLSGSQRSTFQRYLETANLPSTKIGKRCQYYGKPDIWCLILDPPLAKQVYQQLKQQKTFSPALDMKPVKRLRSPERT